MLMFAGQKVQGAFSTSAPLQTFDSHTLLGFIFGPIKSVLGSLNSQSIFFWSNFSLWFALWNQLSHRERISIAGSLISFCIVTIISSARSLQPQYILFSECFLIYAFILLVSRAPNPKLQWLAVLCITTLVFYCGFPKFWSDLNNSANQYSVLCDPSNDYMRWWHGKLDYQKFLASCKERGF